jgi:hypothetical protein
MGESCIVLRLEDGCWLYGAEVGDACPLCCGADWWLEGVADAGLNGLAAYSSRAWSSCSTSQSSLPPELPGFWGGLTLNAGSKGSPW